MTPAEVKALPVRELPRLACDVRARILDVVGANGGHLASSLGAVELAIGLVRVFEPARDRIVWDVGHQAYAWKILTGRDDAFGTLRRLGGLSGFPNPEESPCDAFVSGHAGAALAAAQGMAAARDLKGGDAHVVAIVGEASLANGMALEALCALRSFKRLTLVLNDNAPEPGGCGGRGATALPAFGRSFFESMGLAYRGPVDGHDVSAVVETLEQARLCDGPVVLHLRTVKGRGYAPAEADPTAWHGVPPHAGNGAACAGRTWSGEFGRMLVDLGRKDPRVCAVTAAMPHGTGLVPFAQAFPDRFFDVGICEERAVTFAAGLAKAGMRPVVAIYSTFLQRAFDQIMHDVCILKLPVVFAVDRAGCVGADGRTHHGMFDIPMLRCLPNMSLLQPRSAEMLEKMLAAALASSGPVAIRWPRGATVRECGVQPLSWGLAEQLSAPDARVQLWALGDQVPKARKAADVLAHAGIEAGVVDARFVKPFDADLLARQRASGAFIVSLENGAVAGGFGEAIGADARFGWPDEFVGHGSVEELEGDFGFTAQDVARRVASALGKAGI
jgi:1-deoxy-D-xylulose-5-phosphate synthase